MFAVPVSDESRSDLKLEYRLLALFLVTSIISLLTMRIYDAIASLPAHWDKLTILILISVVTMGSASRLMKAPWQQLLVQAILVGAATTLLSLTI